MTIMGKEINFLKTETYVEAWCIACGEWVEISLGEIMEK